MPARPDVPTRDDPGLQPERTDLAWGRTSLSMIAAAFVFLRWMPHHGWFVGILMAASILTALAINLVRKRRFHRAVEGIREGSMLPDIASAAAVAVSVVLLAVLGIFTVLFLPVHS